MAIPDYIIKAAREYRDAHGGNESLFDAFVAGHKATRTASKPKASDIVLSPESKALFDECWTAYGRKGNIVAAKEEWSKLDMFEVNEVLPHVRAYASCNELGFRKDFERYLKYKIFKSVVVKGNSIIFDPTRVCDNVMANEPQQQTINWQS